MSRGVSGKVAVIALTDTATTPATVVEVSPAVRIQTLEDWGEIDTGDPETLCRFLTRALITYPNARKAIGFWDHGTGVFDETDATEKISDPLGKLGAARPSAAARAPRDGCSSPRTSSQQDIATRSHAARRHQRRRADDDGGRRMIATAFQRAGQQGKIDLIFSDTCLNGMIEVLDELGNYAQVRRGLAGAGARRRLGLSALDVAHLERAAGDGGRLGPYRCASLQFGLCAADQDASLHAGRVPLGPSNDGGIQEFARGDPWPGRYRVLLPPRPRAGEGAGLRQARLL